jgi:P2-related tail formation protein
MLLFMLVCVTLVTLACSSNTRLTEKQAIELVKADLRRIEAHEILRYKAEGRANADLLGFCLWLHRVEGWEAQWNTKEKRWRVTAGDRLEWQVDEVTLLVKPVRRAQGC